MNRRNFMAGSMALAARHKLLRSMSAVSLGASSMHASPLDAQPAAALPMPHDLLSTTYSESFLAARLIPTNDWHPFPKYAERGPWQSIPGDIRAAIIDRAEEDQKTGWSVEPATMFLEFKRTGNQEDWQNANWGRRAQMQRLLLAEMLEAKGRFLDDIANGIWLICEETSWSDNAHMYMQRAGVGLPDVTEPVVDLFAAETSATLAWTRYLIGAQLDQISPLIGKRIVIECERRILAPARDRDDFWWMGFTQNPSSAAANNLQAVNGLSAVPSFGPVAHAHRLNNWTPWINSNLLVTNLLLEEDAKVRLHETTRITRSVDAYLNQYWPDAGEEEGPSYFTRSPLCLFECMSWLDSSTGNSTGIFANPFVAAMGRYILNAHIAGNTYINYGDADMHLGQDGELIYRYGKAVHDNQLAGFGAWCASKSGWTASGNGIKAPMNSNLISLSRALPAVLIADEIRSAPQNEGLVRDAWYPSLGLMTARQTANSTAGMYVAVLAANNGRSHSHNDTGSYIIFQDGEPVTIDVGVETYNAKTFSPDRYKIWTMQSAYHNLPTIGGVMQHDGPNFRATDRQYESNDQHATYSFNLASAYPKEAGVKSWLRTVTLDRLRNRVIVQEDFELDAAVPISLSLMTTRLSTVDAAGSVIMRNASGEGTASLLKYDAAQLQPVVETIQIADQRVRHDIGDRVYRILLNAKQPLASGKWSYEFAPA